MKILGVLLFFVISTAAVHAQTKPSMVEMTKMFQNKRIPAESFSTKFQGWTHRSLTPSISNVAVMVSYYEKPHGTLELFGSGTFVQGGFLITASHNLHEQEFMDDVGDPLRQIVTTEVQALKPGTMIDLQISNVDIEPAEKLSKVLARVVVDLPTLDFALIKVLNRKFQNYGISLNQIADAYAKVGEIFYTVGYGQDDPGYYEQDEARSNMIVNGVRKSIYSKEVIFSKIIDKQNVEDAKTNFRIIASRSQIKNGDSGGGFFRLDDSKYYGILVESSYVNWREPLSYFRKKILLAVPIYLISQLIDLKNLIALSNQIDFAIENQVFNRICMKLRSDQNHQSPLVIDVNQEPKREEYTRLQKNVYDNVGCND